MTREEIISSATSNGYSLGTKTDSELLLDYLFFKAAFGSMGDELLMSSKDANDPLRAMAGFAKSARIRFLVALDGYDAGLTTSAIWTNVGADRITKASCFDVGGKLIPSQLP